MIGPLNWRFLTTRAETRGLQNFTCAADFPTTPGGRRLPHPKPWEWEAQRHLRQLSQLLRPGDVVVSARENDEVMAAAHLQLDADGDVLVLFHAAVGVGLSSRGLGGELADELLARSENLGLERARELGCSHLVVTGKVHVANAPSQQLMARALWEPNSWPVNQYQSWAKLIPVG